GRGRREAEVVHDHLLAIGGRGRRVIAGRRVANSDKARAARAALRSLRGLLDRDAGQDADCQGRDQNLILHKHLHTYGRRKSAPPAAAATAHAAPARIFATATACHTGNSGVTKTSSATAAISTSAIGKCTSRGCKRPVSAIQGYRPGGRRKYSGNNFRAVPVLS